MAFPIPSKQEIQDRIWNKIRSNTTLWANIDSSVIGMITKIVAAELDLVYQTINQVAENSQISTAVGAALDNLGLELGLPRNEAVKSGSLGGPRPVRFTNTGVSSVTIPVQTRIWNDATPQLPFITIEGAIIAAGQSAELHVTAVETGEVYNVGIGQLNKHNVSNASVTVQNILPIQNGRLKETDASYRERIIQDYRRRKVLNLSNLAAMLRGVSGVKDVFVLNLARGDGTVDCIIIPYSYTDTNQVVAECNRVLIENVDAGISARAKGPNYRQLTVSINIRFTPSVGDRREDVRESIRQQIRARIDNMPVETGQGEGSLYVGQLRAAAQIADASVLDANLSLMLDGSPIGNEGEIRIAVGERIVLTALEVS